LILTKPLGSGILSTAIKADLLSLEQINEVASIMAQLNFYALKALSGIKVYAATDVTGFGFLGHLSEMLNDKISFNVFEKDVLRKNLPIWASSQREATKTANLQSIL